MCVMLWTPHLGSHPYSTMTFLQSKLPQLTKSQQFQAFPTSVLAHVIAEQEERQIIVSQ
jgi:hypothetical protein